MTRPRAPYLLQRYGAYFLRVRVPNELRERLDVIEVRRSLRTSSFAHARLLALTYGTRLRRAFDQMLLQDHGKKQCRAIVRGIFVDLAREADGGFVPVTRDPDEERAEQRDMSDEYRAEVSRQLAAGEFIGEVAAQITRLLGQHGVATALLNAEARQDLVEGVARAIIEQQRLFAFRLNDRLAPYTPADPLFGSESSLPGGAAAVQIAPVQAEAPGLTIEELITEYTRSKAPEWTEKTCRTHRAKLDLLAAHVGTDRRISTITSQDVWAFRDGVVRLRRGYHATGGSSFASLQTDAEAGRITAATATNILARIKSLFRWARQRNLCAIDPADGVQITQPKAKKGVRSRRSFTGPELKTLFDSPVFAGSRSAGRRFEPGTFMIRDAYYWLPLLGLYTGARLGELVQLHFEDVVLDHPVPHLSINEDDHGADRKHVKTDAGVRTVPIHPDLIEGGFVDFVRLRLKNRGKRHRLFWEVKFGADGQASTVFSKWFGRLLDRVGLDDPALCFHSFRHTVEDAFRNAETPQYITDQLMGHADGSSAGKYGVGADLGVTSKWVATLALPHYPLKLGETNAKGLANGSAYP